jgi:hypothetical protein
MGQYISYSYDFKKPMIRLQYPHTVWGTHEVRIGRHLSDKFPIQNGLKQGDALSPLLLNYALEYTIREVQEKQV